MTATEPRTPEPAAVANYLRKFAITVGLVGAATIAVNVATFRVVKNPEHASVVQLEEGWSRLYKPILFDEAQPQVAVFGRSFARDAFDPADVGTLIGKRFFNFAVSGGSAYENRRFAQAAATDPKLEAVILSLDSFDATPGAPKASYGFDESILPVSADGRPNRFFQLHRAAAVTLSGAAVGNNIRLLWAFGRVARGESKEAVLSSYERRDNRRNAAMLSAARNALFPAILPPAPVPLVLPDPEGSSGLDEFDRAIDIYCGRDIDVAVYLTPRSPGACLQSTAFRLRAFAYLKARQAACRARFHFYDFQYPNAVTLEGVANPVPVSTYYRPDGHPRPTIGMLMASVMFAKAFPAGTPQEVAADFGTDLMAAPDPLGWWQRRLDRCAGRWAPGDAAMVTAGAIP